MSEPVVQARQYFRPDRRPAPLRTWAAALAVLCLTLAMGAGAASPALALQQAEVEAQTKGTYGRLVFKFRSLPKYDIQVNTGVIVLDFGEAVELDASDIPVKLKDFIGAARLDDDKTALRFALVREVLVNTMEAGDRLFVDFLPDDWEGLPPGLPPDVVAEMAMLAKKAEEEAKLQALRDAGLSENPDVRVSTGEYPTFSRVVFHWDRDIRPTLSRDDNVVSIAFNAKGRPDLARLRANPPRLVKGAGTREIDDELVVYLQVERVANVRAFREGKSYVVDISDAADPLDASVAEAILRETGLGNGTGDKDEETVKDGGDEEGEQQKKAATPEKTGMTELVGEMPRQEVAQVAETAAVKVSYSEFDPESVAPGGFADAAAASFGPGGRADKPEQADSGRAPAAKEAAPPGKAAARGDGGKTMTRRDGVTVGQRGNVEPDAASPDASQPMQELEEAAPAGRRIAVKTQRIGSSLRLTFPFPDKVSAAVFTRAGTVWLVFDSDVIIDLGNLEKDYSDRLRSVKLTRSGPMQYLRMELEHRDLTTATAEANDWVITIGDTILEPTAPLALTRRLADDGEPQVAVELKDPGKVHWLRDPALGDMLAVVTAFGPPRGLIKPQNFVEFNTFISAHGMALQPIADDLRVTLRLDELIISRGGGLWLSAGGAHQYAAGRSDAGSGHRPGFIDFNALREGGVPAYLERRQFFERQASNAEKAKKAPARLALARFYLAYGLSAEALGVLERMLEDDAQIVRDPAFNAVRAIANIMMGRHELARGDLAVHGLSQSTDVKLWNGLMEAAAKNWRDAQLSIAEAETALADYPEEWQAKFRLTAARAALEVKDLADANYQLDAVSKATVTPELKQEALLLRGRYLEALGRTEDALAAYEDVQEADIRPTAAEAMLREVALKHKLKMIDDDKAIEGLETVSVSWRGDDTELEALQKLSRLFADRGEYRRAFEALKTAGLVDSNSKITRRMQDEMALVFEDLFVHGKADKMATIDAVSLFYDYRNLTPVGRLGDEMIRNLAERLISVNLLDQAAELLEHQIENRLKGAARAQIAAKLATVYLKNHQPRQALQALNKTRMAQLPGGLQRHRDMLQARALSEAGRHDQALSLLDVLQGDDVERLRADTLWQGRMWQRAAEQIEKVLGGVWQDKEPLSDLQRYNVMRAAISFSLAEDQLGLDRLRTKFAAKMASSPDARGFQVVTAPVSSRGDAFNNLAKDIAKIDTLEAFLSDVRKSLKPGAGPGDNGAQPGAAPAPAAANEQAPSQG